MDLKFNDIEAFIQKYYKTFMNQDILIQYSNNTFHISFDNDIENSFGIKITGNVNSCFTFDHRFEKINNSFYSSITNKLLVILNTKVEIPLSILLNKEVVSSHQKSVFVLGMENIVSNITQENLDILKISKKIYTNEVEDLRSILFEILGEKKDIFHFDDLIHGEIDEDVVLVHYGDYLKTFSQIHLIIKKALDMNYKIYISPIYTDFMNNYSLSNANYGNLLYVGYYSQGQFIHSYQSVFEKLDFYIHYTKSIITQRIPGSSMLQSSTFSIEFGCVLDLHYFLDELGKKILPPFLNIEIIAQNKNGYFNIIDKIGSINAEKISEWQDIFHISVFIYKPEIPVGNGKYVKYNSITGGSIFRFISTPLSNSGEFSPNIKEKIMDSQYIYGESIEGVEGFLEKLDIDPQKKKIYFGDDLIGIREYKQEHNLGYSTENDLALIPKVFPELISLLEKGENIDYISDGGIPCILDPGDNIKKYIRNNYPHYSIIGEKGSSVIPTVLLSAFSKKKYVFWAPLIYSIYPGYDYLVKEQLFGRENFRDTVSVFYSFGKNIEKDVDVVKHLFEYGVYIQIIGDIGTPREYNRLFQLEKISSKEINFIYNNLDNLVYIVSY